MPRDYAHRGNSSRRQAHTRSRGGRKGATPGWVWLVAGLAVGLAVAAFVYIARPVPPALPELASHSGKAAPEPAKKSGPIPLPPKEKPRFTFYEILRNQEVVIPKEDSRGSAPPPPADSDGAGGEYVIQVASYRTQADAERLKANLALLGIESRIETVTIDKKDTYYRVRVGPEKNWKQVQANMARLDENGIDAMLIKLR